MKCIYFATDNHALIKLRKLICMPLTAINHFAVSHHDRFPTVSVTSTGCGCAPGQGEQEQLGGDAKAAANEIVLRGLHGAGLGVRHKFVLFP